MTHAWQAATVKMLNLKDNSAGASAGEEKAEMEALARFRNAYYKRLAENIRGDAYFLLDGLDKDKSRTRLEDLVHLIRTTGDLSAELCEQKAQMRSSKRDLRTEFLFSIDSPSIKARPCMCLETGDRRYDGRRVQLIPEPALLAAGNEDGKNYDQSKIRMPGIGWLSKEDPKRITPSPSPPIEASDLRNTITNADGLYDGVGSNLRGHPRDQNVGMCLKLCRQ